MVVRFLTEKATKHLLISVFIFLGIALMIARSVYFSAERVLPEDTAWKITLSTKYIAKKNSTIIRVTRPKVGKYVRVISHRMYHPGSRLLATRPDARSTSASRFKATRDGLSELMVEYHVQLSAIPRSQSLLNILTPDLRQQYLESGTGIDLSTPALLQLNDFLKVNAENKPQLLQAFFLHSQKLLKTTDTKFDDISTAIHANKATALGRSRLMVGLCRLNSISARVATGFILEEKNNSRPYHWVQIFDEETGWIDYDPEKGFFEEIPENYVAFTYLFSEPLHFEESKPISVTYSVSEDLDILNTERISQEKTFLDVFDLRRLDLDTKDALIKILILPFCILLTAFLRHVVGLFPYGVFTSALLALAMTYAETFITLTIAGVVISLALLGRSILPGTLSRPPRLSLIFTFVAISMVFSVSLLSYFSIDTGGSIILLPTIILVSIVDRFYSYMDDKGAHAALLRLAVTIVIAILCLPLLHIDFLNEFIIKYPEAHFITAAMVLMLAGYKGKKFTDIKYLVLLGENKIKTGKTKNEPADD